MKRPSKPEIRAVSDDPLEEALRLTGEGDFHGSLRLLAELEQRFPDDPEVVLTTTVAALRCNRVARAARAFARFAERWPGHRKAAQVAKAAEGLRGPLEQVMREYGIADLELAALHEEASALLAAGVFEEALRLTDAVLARLPECAAAHNNRAQLFWLSGDPAAASAEVEDVLARDPANLSALCSLARFRFLAGEIAPAQAVAGRLMEAPHLTDESFFHKMEALSYLGADGAVVALYEMALREGSGERLENAMLHHLGAVAAARLGREAQARGAWNTALRHAPSLEIVKQNLDDSRARPADRHGAWPFPLSAWVSTHDLRDLQAALQTAGEQGLAPAMRSYLARLPGAHVLVRTLLERGDPVGRDFGITLAANAQTAEMDGLFAEFAQRPFGPDRLRISAVRQAVARGVLPSGPVRIWLNGVRRVTIAGVLEPEKDVRPRPQVRDALAAARDAVDENRWEDAEALLAALQDLPRLTRDEAASLCESRVRMLAALERRDEAREWLEVWGDVRSGSPAIAEWKKKLEAS